MLHVVSLLRRFLNKPLGGCVSAIFLAPVNLGYCRYCNKGPIGTPTARAEILMVGLAIIPYHKSIE